MKKMCFSERFGLHDAVLEGRKTHTRRMIPLSALAKIEAFQREYYEATLDRLDGIELPEQYYTAFANSVNLAALAYAQEQLHHNTNLNQQ